MSDRPRFLRELGDVERRYTLAVHDVYCDEQPPHGTADHEPFDDPDAWVPFSELEAALARHGLALVRTERPS